MARFGFAFFGSGVRFGSPNASTASHMRNLSRFLDNPFDDLRISLARLIAFATDNIQRMIANNEIPRNVDLMLGKPARLAELREALATCCNR